MIDAGLGVKSLLSTTTIYKLECEFMYISNNLHAIPTPITMMPCLLNASALSSYNNYTVSWAPPPYTVHTSRRTILPQFLYTSAWPLLCAHQTLGDLSLLSSHCFSWQDNIPWPCQLLTIDLYNSCVTCTICSNTQQCSFIILDSYFSC